MSEQPEDGLEFSIEDEIAEDQEFLKFEDEKQEFEKYFPISAEPELVAEIPASDIPPKEEIQESHLTSTVCDVCLELNLIHANNVIQCSRCEQAFCFHFTSNIDAQYCVNCMSDMSITKSVVTKEYIHRDEERNVTSVYRRRAREIQIKGLDWLFAQRKIYELSDTELDMMIEYHRNILTLMIAEQEARRNAKMHRYAGVRVTIPTPSTTSILNTTTTTVKKTRTMSKTKQNEQLQALLKSVLAKGLTMDQITAALRK